MTSFAGNQIVLYGGGFSGFVYQWNLSSAVKVSSVKAHSAQIRSLQLIDTILYSASHDYKAKAWNTNDFEIVRVFDGNCILVPNFLSVQRDWFNGNQPRIFGCLRG